MIGLLISLFLTMAFIYFFIKFFCKDNKSTRKGIYTGFKLYIPNIIIKGVMDCWFWNFKMRCHEDKDRNDEFNLENKKFWIIGEIISNVFYLIFGCYMYRIVFQFSIRPLGRK